MVLQIPFALTTEEKARSFPGVVEYPSCEAWAHSYMDYDTSSSEGYIPPLFLFFGGKPSGSGAFLFLRAFTT